MTNEYLTQLACRAYAIAKRKKLFTDAYQDLILIASEVVELTKALRKGHHALRERYEHSIANVENLKYKDPIHDEKYLAFELYIKDTIEDEFADIILRILSYSKRYGYNLNAKLDDTASGDIYKILSVILFHISSFNLRDAIRLTIALAEREGIDLEWHLEEKTNYNETRKWK